MTSQTAPDSVASTATTGVSVRDGLATHGPDGAALRAGLDATFAGWGAREGAVTAAYPALLRVDDLDRLDYFRNFPHLAVVASGLAPAAVEDHYAGADDVTEVPPTHLVAAGHVLPSAACYSVYLDLAGSVVDRAERVTTVANCFRREGRFDGLRRLLGFSMREVVCVGHRDAVLDHLASFKARIGAFLDALDLPAAVQVASDPFFDSSASRAVMQQLFPVKEEFVYGGDLAIASMNYHRNFFGERCGIALAGGEPAFSGCVAFGLERWIAALVEHFGDDLPALLGRVAAVTGAGA